MKSLSILFVLLALLSWRTAHAAPFCVETQTLPPECLYTDVTECRKRANQLQGVCTTNKAEFELQPGQGQFCVVYSDRSSKCVYADRGSCDEEASRSQGVCIENMPQSMKYSPYSKDPNRKY